MKYVDVILQRWQVAYAKEEAERRAANATRIGARHGTTANAGMASSDAHQIGALCELATAVFTGLEERFFDDDAMNLPDVGLIEVRGTKRKNADLRVYRTDVTKAEFMVLGVILEGSDAGAIIRLEGWAWSEHAWNYSKPAPYEPHPKRGPAHYFARTSLHPMTTLVKTHRFMEAS